MGDRLHRGRSSIFQKGDMDGYEQVNGNFASNNGIT